MRIDLRKDGIVELCFDRRGEAVTGTDDLVSKEGRDSPEEAVAARVPG